ncbi:hypothetical protein [Williamsia sp. D3]|uniref:hypothetical protein n=1 Tax=Williamsia sp. D3 TaxID=1313067 RepID=UPI0003D3990A|nr:hypothetical protein [Williamsia sp. D3]ETD31524.1 hypothetical protein W823_19270 [Williamsia sp. D3]
MPVSFRAWPSFGGGRRRRALRRAGEVLADEAKALSPDETGALDESVREDLLDDDSIRVSFNTEYAVRQHYSKKNRHDNGERLFLLKATETAAPRIEQILADEIRRSLGR